ncbi:MAG: acyl-CoA thioesterase [Muribaculaceae bacterium]|nr:acyl-CoA thioesterase [Muribaculaceae bacterium]
MDQILKTTIPLKIRFSEVDSLKIVWHGSYSLYFEDAREAFGKQYGLGYKLIYDSGFYAPLVELSFQFKRPLIYGMTPTITITYKPTAAAKIVFDYEITDTQTGEIVATGRSVQVFLDRDYQLIWTSPDFYTQWKNKWKVNTTELKTP